MRVLVLAALAAASVSAMGQQEQVFQVEYTNQGLIPARWTLSFDPDGRGHFRTERGTAPRPEKEFEAPDQDRDVQLSGKFAGHAFEVAKQKRMFRSGCESRMKVAFQGIKKLSYSGPDGQGSCEFNYSKDAEIEGLGDDFISVANTLIEGARLQILMQHDRLGLDHETEMLTQFAADGRALQIGSIRDILERLAGDDSVMERVRRRARALLARAED